MVHTPEQILKQCIEEAPGYNWRIEKTKSEGKREYVCCDICDTKDMFMRVWGGGNDQSCMLITLVGEPDDDYFRWDVALRKKDSGEEYVIRFDIQVSYDEPCMKKACGVIEKVAKEIMNEFPSNKYERFEN